MRKFLIALLLVLFLSPLSQAQLKDNDFIAICGDSITEQKIYSVDIEDYLLMCQPQQNLSAMNHGWSGQSTWDFAARMQDDTLRYQPTVATTCFGMNDGGYAAPNPPRMQRYREMTQQIIDKFKKAGVRVIVIGSSGPVDTTTFNRMGVGATVYNPTLAALRDIAQDVAKQNNVIFADLYSPMIDVMAKAKEKYGPNYDVCGRDGIHPQANGQLIMAYAFLKALGCNGDIGTISVDLDGNKATASAGHKIKSIKDGSVEIVSTRYPFCFGGDPKSPNATSGIIEFFPFNEDLNRFRLIVTNTGTAQKLKVTWGASSKQYTPEQLASGINLAAEFLDNPFGDFFKLVDQAVRQQQGYETPMIRSFVHSLPQYMSMVPEEGGKELQNVADLMARERARFQSEAAKQVLPVTHTIKIEKVE